MNDIIDAWLIHNRINLYLLEALNEEHLGDVPTGSKGRTVGEVFAHMHNVRLMWLKVAWPALHDKQTKIDKDEPLPKGILSDRLEESADAIAQLLEKGYADGKIKGFKPHPSAFFAYFVSHESHHRGQIALALKQSGHKLDQKISYGMWEWGSR